MRHLCSNFKLRLDFKTCESKYLIETLGPSRGVLLKQSPKFGDILPLHATSVDCDEMDEEPQIFSQMGQEVLEKCRINCPCKSILVCFKEQ